MSCVNTIIQHSESFGLQNDGANKNEKSVLMVSRNCGNRQLIFSQYTGRNIKNTTTQLRVFCQLFFDAFQLPEVMFDMHLGILIPLRSIEPAARPVFRTEGRIGLFYF